MTKLHTIAATMVSIVLTASACGGGDDDPEGATTSSPSASSSTSAAPAGDAPQICLDAVDSGSKVIEGFTTLLTTVQDTPALVEKSRKLAAEGDVDGVKGVQREGLAVLDESNAAGERLQKVADTYDAAEQECVNEGMPDRCQDMFDQTRAARNEFSTVYTQLRKYLPLITDLAVAVGGGDDAEIAAVESKIEQYGTTASTASTKAQDIIRGLGDMRTECLGQGTR